MRIGLHKNSNDFSVSIVPNSPLKWYSELFKSIIVEEDTLTPVDDVGSPIKDDEEIQLNLDSKCRIIRVQEQEKEIVEVENDPENQSNTQNCSSQNTYSTNNRILEDISREFRRWNDIHVICFCHIHLNDQKYATLW